MFKSHLVLEKSYNSTKIRKCMYANRKEMQNPILS